MSVMAELRLFTELVSRISDAVQRPRVRARDACPGRSAARSGALQTRDRYRLRRITARNDPGSAAHHSASLHAALRPGHAASHPPRIEHRLLAGAVALERALLADRVGALEDPVLPGGEAGEDFRLHGLG